MIRVIYFEKNGRRKVFVVDDLTRRKRKDLRNWLTLQDLTVLMTYLDSGKAET